MEKKPRRSVKLEFTLPTATASDLRGKQSVRATFKLTAQAIEALNIVAVHLGIKQKSLFDHLIEDMPSLNTIAREINRRRFGRLNRVQKTFVISRKTLSCLDQTSKDFDTPRDALVEYSIQRLLPIIAKERKKHQKRKQLLKELARLIDHGEMILAQSQTELGKDDPVSDKLQGAMAMWKNAYQSIDAYVQRGKIIEDFVAEALEGQ